MRRILYLLDQPIDEKNFDRFGVLCWQKQGWVVEVWDLTPFLHPNVWQDFLRTGRRLQQFDGSVTLSSAKEIDVALSRIGQVGYFVDLLDDSWRELSIKRRLISRGGRRIVLIFGMIPEPAGSSVMKARALLAKGPAAITRRIGRGIARTVLSAPLSSSLFVVSGHASERVAQAARCGKILRAHGLDYDLYLKLANAPRGAKRDYAVFIDQNICFHSDFLYLKIRHYVTEKNYFPILCRGLRRIANEFQVESVIAAHPRSSYQTAGCDYFDGIEVVFGRTAELIRDARIVVCHYSTAIHLAVLFEKPLLFVTTGEMSASPGGRLIRSFADALRRSVINLDGDLDKVDWMSLMEVDRARYAEYREEYIKIAGTPRAPFWDIVASELGAQEVGEHAAVKVPGHDSVHPASAGVPKR